MTNPFANINVNGPAAGGTPFGGGSILADVTHGRAVQGQRIVIGGVEKIGKTTLAMDAPRALLAQLEIGGAAVNGAKTRFLTSWADVLRLLDEIRSQAVAGNFPFKTIVWDTATALERLIHEATIQADNKGRQSMETAMGGYGKAYAYANGLFDDFTKRCDELAINAGINHVLTCHVFAAKQVDPAFGEFDQWDILLHSPKNNRTYGKREMITQWADMIGFLHEPMFITKGEGEHLQKAQSLNRGHVMAVSRTPGYVAGNRYGITGEIAIPDPARNPYGTAWNNLAHAIYNSSGIDVFNRDAA